MENKSGTPDFILASFVLKSLQVYCDIIKQRDNWYNFKPLGRDKTNGYSNSTLPENNGQPIVKHDRLTKEDL